MSNSKKTHPIPLTEVIHLIKFKGKKSMLILGTEYKPQDHCAKCLVALTMKHAVRIVVTYL
jgi:Ni,Fe-hydrogenase maturation factor